jgi:hypothetical protein
MVCDECDGLGLCGCDCDCVFGVVEAPDGEPVAGRVPLGEVRVRVYDRGPEPEFHKDRALFGPWLPYEAELAEQPGATGVGWTAAEAIGRALAAREAVLTSIWPALGSGSRAMCTPHAGEVA